MKPPYREQPPEGKCHCTAYLQFDWIGFYQTRKHVLSRATESKPVKLETSRALILPLAPTVSVLCSQCDQIGRFIGLKVTF